MPHCTADELIDVVDGHRAVSSLPHLAECAACRTQLDELREMIADIATAEVPEPSPLYWGQFSARIRDVVEREQPGPWGRWGWTGVSWHWAPVAAVAALVLAVVALRGGGGTVADVPSSGGSEAAAERPDSRDRTERTGELLVAFMQDLVEGVDADAVRPALFPDAAATDAAMAELSGDERAELRRLLQEALAGSGA